MVFRQRLMLGEGNGSMDAQARALPMGKALGQVVVGSVAALELQHRLAGAA
jgi:hypothetical protein